MSSQWPQWPCPACGTAFLEEARFCMKCGRARGEAPSDAPQAPPSQPVQPAPPSAPPPPGFGPGFGTGPGAQPGFGAGGGPGHPAAPGGPPPPGYGPTYAPAGASPLGAFLGRAFRGGWAASAQAALWPVGLLLIAAAGLAIPSYGQEEGEAPVSFTDRFRLITAMLLQGLGGGFEAQGPSGDDSNPFGGSESSGFLDGSSAESGTATLSMVPLTFTVLWIVALLIGVRMLRARQAAAPALSRTAGLEAAVRIAVVAGVAVLVLALFAQPTVEDVEVSSAPVLSALGALGLTLVTALALLHRDDLAGWLAVRPGVHACVRAGATAVRALAVVLALSALVAYLCLAAQDDMEKEGLLVLLAFLPNLGAAALAVGWGGSLEFTASRNSEFSGDRTESESVGLSDLADLTNDWAMVGGLALGAVCALVVGVLAARRHANRGEQPLAAGLFFALLLIVAAASGLAVEGSAGELAELGGEGSFEAGPSIPELLLFGLLWLSAATFLGPYVLRMTGNGSLPPAPYAPPAPGYAPPGVGMPGAPAAPHTPEAPGAQPVYDLGMLGSAASAQDVTEGAQPPAPEALYSHAYAPTATAPAAGPPPQRPRAAVWIVTLTAALVLGAGATAGFLLLQDDGDDPAPKDAKPSASASPGAESTASEPSTAEPSPSDSTASDPSTDPTAGSDATAGTDSRIVTDSAGFSFAVPDVWDRVSEENGQITYAGSTGFGHFLIGVVPDAPVSSYENFRTIEQKSQKNPDYQRIRLEENTFQGRPGAVWEYTYTEEETGRTVHAIDQGYVAEDGTEYAIYFTDYEESWEPSGREIFEEALATWRLTG
ncbi:hypothetical protein H9Y04_39445 [Streptomyces sp. TRM66268-LWL]|uniref:Zinc ribbon domain-containing protein n=1 Tax=Streptomyces polyasparticus TaxID=2767826 RepID=A0ABR7SWB2_9ACTN|nr:zinc ribbon domain-containing protein [Streptomyces polyasparticus]MBC9718618.1 hypothetical protein [Streptomyces polyasparticus]